MIASAYNNSKSVHTIYEFSLSISPGYKIPERPAQIIYLSIYGEKVVREDGVFPLSVSDMTEKNIWLILRFHGISSSFFNSRVSTVCRNHVWSSDCTSDRTYDCTLSFLIYSLGDRRLLKLSKYTTRLFFLAYATQWVPDSIVLSRFTILHSSVTRYAWKYL